MAGPAETGQEDRPDAIRAVLRTIEETFRTGTVPADLPGLYDEKTREELAALLADLSATQRFGQSLARGDLSQDLHVTGRTAGCLKALQSNLRHLTWQAGQVAKGDLSQRIDFMGGFSASFNAMTESLSKVERCRTEREDELRRSRDYYLRLFDDFPNPIWRAGPDAKCNYFNREWLAFTGRTLEQERGDRWTEGVHPEDFDRCQKTWLGAFARHEPFEMEYRLRYHDGSYRWLLDYGKPFFELDGTFAGYIGSCYDIHDRKRAEDAVQAAVRLNQQIDALSIAECMSSTLEEAEKLTLSRIGFFHFVNDDEKTIQLTAWSTETKKHCSLPGETHRSYPVEKAGVWLDCMRERRPVVHNDYANLPHKKGLPAGHAPIVRELVVPIFDAGRIVAIIGVGNKAGKYDERDIDILSLLAKNAWTLIRRKKAEESLQESGKQYRELVENLSEVIVSLDTEGKITYISPVVGRLYGYAAGELAGMHFLQFVHPDDRGRVSRIFSQECTGSCQTDEFRVLARDGSTRWISVSPRPIERDGHIAGVNYVMADITEYKKADEEERLTRERFETLVKIAGMQDADEKTLSEFVLQAACRMTASTLAFIGTMTPDEAVMDIISWSASVMDECQVRSSPLHYPVNRAGIWAEAVREHRPTIVNDYAGSTYPSKKGLPEGHVTITRFLSLPVIDNGKVVMVAAVANKPDDYDEADVTRLTLLMQGIWGNLRKRRADEALRESEEKFREIFNNINDSIELHEIRNDGLPGRFLEVNEVTCRMLGYSREELLEKSPLDFAIDYHDRPLEEIGREIIVKGHARFETGHKRRDGTIIPVEINAHIVRHGDTTRALSVVRDITERKKAGDELRQSEERFRTLTETSLTGIYIFQKGRIRYVNPTFAHIFGYQPGEMIGMDPLSLVHPDDREMVRERMQHRFDRKETISVYESRMMTRDNRTIMVSIMGVLIPYEDRPAISGNLLDITERKTMEDALRMANKKITMLSSITRHDIRNQLLALRGFLALSGMQTTDPKLAEYLLKGDRAAEAISSQIEFTKYYEEIGVNAPEWQDIPELVQTARAQLPLPETIRILTDVPPLKVFADRLIEKVFYNLMENTLRHGEHVSRIRFSFAETDCGAEIVYEDDGVGIPPEDKLHLFQKGFGRNTGLGLFLSREILAITGLSIREEGDPGKGVRFVIAVPKGAYRKDGSG